MDQQVCYIIGQNGSYLYGIACNNRAYMRQKYPNGAWYGIEKEVWEAAKTNAGNISSNLVTIEDSYSHSGDPHDDKIKGSPTQWGGKYCNGGQWVLPSNYSESESDDLAPTTPHNVEFTIFT